MIFLATSQWFVRLDGDPAITGEDGVTRTLREAARQAIDHQVRWIPSWGRDRIFNMVSNRPDWCISRQRAWGVPIPAVDCTTCGEAVLTPALVEKAASVFDEYGADAWYERPIEEFLPAGLSCPSCGGTSFERERDILDVWFDSGSSHEAVLPRYADLTWPSDMYLEGSDQHRGWFQSSLLVALATRGRPPFREVLTHGFLIDLEGRKMSKSVGNVISPQDVIKESGAEILRLWVAASDYSEELRVSKEILTRVVDTYRKLRNTSPHPRGEPVRLRSGRGHAADREARRGGPLRPRPLCGRRAAGPHAYEAYDFPTVYQTLNTLATVDLSAFYVDVTKDRMYTLGARSHERRSTQTAMYLIGDGLARLLAPILPVTADDLWRHLPGTRSASVHLEAFPEVGRYADADLMGTWERLMRVREEVNAALERKRKDKVIGNSLGARVIITTTGPVGRLLEDHRALLPMLFIVSDLALHVGPTEGADQIRVEVEKAPGVKCERCWRYVPSTRTEPDWAGLCDRCVDALAAPVNR